MTEQDDDAVVERFPPTSGRFTGVLGLVTTGVILAFSVLAWDPGTPLAVAILACSGAVLAWTVLLRPALWVTGRDLVMRNMLHTVRIPLAAIDRVVVAQVLAVSAGGRRYVSPAIGYSVRQTVRRKAHARSGSAQAPSAVDTYQVFVEEQIVHHADEARDRHRIAKGSPEQEALAAGVRKIPAWPEIAGLAGTALAFVVWSIV